VQNAQIIALELEEILRDAFPQKLKIPELFS
jgi:hypothetical protein